MAKGQLKIQEMAFVLLALALLGTMAFLFYARIQSQNIMGTAESLKEERALSLRDRIVSLPEIKCAEKICLDLDKVEMLKEYEVDHLFRGITEVKVLQIYPIEEEIYALPSA